MLHCVINSFIFLLTIMDWNETSHKEKIMPPSVYCCAITLAFRASHYGLVKGKA